MRKDRSTEKVIAQVIAIFVVAGLVTWAICWWVLQE